MATRAFPSGGPLKRHVAVRAKGVRINLRPDHPALTDARSLFPSTVASPADFARVPRLLISGHNSRKIGKMVTKGRWKRFPVYTLTLEERATCPTECGQWRTCYGNNMHYARRLMGGMALEARLIDEVVELERKHPGGFVVRLHVLGDFYSAGYVDLWHQLMQECPALHVFGFTARKLSSTIGAAVRFIGRIYPDRWCVRFSGLPVSYGAIVISTEAERPAGAIICPAELGRTDCCGTCGLCWTADRPIAFLEH